jgi:hypothetical protein
MHFTLPDPCLNLHEQMSGGAGSDGVSHTSHFPGVYIGGFLQQQRVFAQVEIPGTQGSHQVVVFPTDWREQRRIIIAPILPLSPFSAILDRLPGLDTSHFITDFSSKWAPLGCVAGFRVPSTFHSSFHRRPPADAAEHISWTLHDVCGGRMIASFSTPTQPAVL